MSPPTSLPILFSLFSLSSKKIAQQRWKWLDEWTFHRAFPRAWARTNVETMGNKIAYPFLPPFLFRIPLSLLSLCFGRRVITRWTEERRWKILGGEDESSENNFTERPSIEQILGGVYY